MQCNVNAQQYGLWNEYEKVSINSEFIKLKKINTKDFIIK